MAQATESATTEKPGVTVRKTKDGLKVSFDYHPALVTRIARIPGAEFSAGDEAWKVPLDQREELDKAVKDMSNTLERDSAARTEIERATLQSVRQIMKDEGMEFVDPKISDYRSKDRATVGEILQANSHWAAQLTGFGRENGAAFVTLHRTASLSAPVFKGDDVAIRYDERGRGSVEPHSPALEKTLGKEVDGVTVNEKDGKLKISFEYNRDMAARLQRIDGVEYVAAERAYEIASTAKPFVERALRDMRKIYREDQEATREMEYIAHEKMDGAKLIKPFLKESPQYSGPIVGVNDQFVLQHTGKEYFAMHRKTDLSTLPRIGENVKIQYEHGHGKVQPKVQQRDQSHSR